MAARSPLVLTRRGRVALGGLVLTVAGAAVWVALDRDVTGVRALEEGQPETAAPTPTATPSPSPEAPPIRAAITPRIPDEGQSEVGEGEGAALADAIRSLVDHAPVVVVAGTSDVVPQARGEAWRLGVPVVPATLDGLPQLLEDLGTEVVVHLQAQPTDGATATPADVDDVDVRAVPVDGTRVERESIEDLHPGVPAATDRALVLVPSGDPVQRWLEPLARAAGARLVPMAAALVDDPPTIEELRSHPELPWLAVGTTQQWKGRQPGLLDWDVDVVRAGTELPGGGYRLFPGRRLVALYGSPGTSALGVLGEQPVEAAVKRAKEQAREYADLVDDPVVPTFEIIATIASRESGDGGDYSRRVPKDLIREWIDAAGDAGMYVILDLQAGRTDFLTQAKELEDLLRHPHVGLALDPEWRLQPDQVHLDQIGSVPVQEVQDVADWLAVLTREHGLPQKLLLLHQFRLSMLPDREQLRVPAEVAAVVQMDGQGAQATKMETWRVVTTSPAPRGVRFGWKNFHDEDTTLRGPAETLAVRPSPVLVSYQ